MMQYDTNSDVIPPATQFLLSEANKISPVTPEGTPTVASQVLQQAGAMPPMPPQMGMPQVKQMAGLGAQVGATQQQQEQQKMMQMLKQLAQRDQSMNFGVMAAPGAQQFKAPGMAGGGIVGYNGQDGSDVRYPGLMQYEGGGDTLLPRTTGYEGMGAWEALKKMYEDLTGKLPKGSLADIQKRKLDESESEERMRGYKPRRTPETLAMEEGILAGRQAKPEAPPAPPETGIAAPGVARPQAARTAGIAQLMGPPVPSPVERREAEVKRLIGGMEAAPVKTFGQLNEEDAAFRREAGLAADPDAAARQRLDALRAEAEAEQKRRVTTPEGEMWNKLIAGLAGAAGKSNVGYMGAGIAAGTQNAAEAIEAEKQRNFKLFREFKQAEAKELDLLEKAKEQRMYGRKADADKSVADARAFANKKAEILAQSTMDFGKIEEAYAKIKSAEDIAKMEAAARGADRALNRESLDFNKLQTAYSVAQQRVVDATKKAQEILKERHPMAMLFEMNPEAKTKNPEAYANYVTDRVRLERELIKPAVAQREALAAKLGFAQPATNAPAPGTVMEGYRFKGGNPADRANWEKV